MNRVLLRVKDRYKMFPGSWQRLYFWRLARL